MLIKTFNTVDELTIKDISDNEYSVSGPLIKFNIKDLDGEQFDPDGDYGLEDGRLKTSVYYHHGLDETIGKKTLGTGIITRVDNTLWIEAQLKKREKYERDIYQLLKDRKLGWSSGTAGHLAESKMINGIKTWVKWPLGLDASLTPTPAEYSNTATIKTETVNSKIEILEEKNMADETKNGEEVKEVKSTGNSLDEKVVNFEGQLKTVNETLLTLTKRLDEMPTKSKAGFLSETGGKSDSTVKSFGDFLVSIQRGDSQRLKSVYGSQYTKDQTVETGTSGGYLVPVEQSTEILKLAVDGSQILPLITRVPVSTFSGNYPALDSSINPTAGSGETVAASGIATANRNPGGTFTETDFSVSQVQWQAKEIGGYTQVQKELSADSPQSIEALLRSLFAIAVRSKNERNALRGNGVGEWLGVLNSPIAVAVTPDTDNLFAWADALEMVSHLKIVNPNSVRWNIHQSLLPDIGQFETTGGGGVIQADLSAPLGMRILGYPIAMTEHAPQANNSGCASLVDWSAYIMFMRSELMIDFSEHVGFLNGLDTWRFYQRSDGKPWLKSKIELADPQGSFYVSPVVYLND